MILDNTGTAAAGTVEFILYSSGESRDSNKSAELPGLEIAYGLTANTELNVVLPRQVSDGVTIIDEETGTSEPKRDAGLGEGAVGWKWRFLESDSYALAFAPVFLFPLSDAAQIRGLVQDSYQLDLPLLASWTKGPWELTGQVSYSWLSNDLNNVFVGASVGFAATERLRLLGEAYTIQIYRDNKEADFANWRLGVEMEFARGFQLLAAVGGEITSDLPPEDRLNFDYYIGLRWVMR
jgi:hypothetical protein